MRHPEMKSWKLILLAALAWGLAAGPAFASALDDAKAAGHVGERFDGYLGLVKDDAPASAKALVSDINAKRKAHYAKIAKKQGTQTAAVAAVAGEKLLKKASAGHYVMPTKDKWVRVKP